MWIYKIYNVFWTTPGPRLTYIENLSMPMTSDKTYDWKAPISGKSRTRFHHIFKETAATALLGLFQKKKKK